MQNEREEQHLFLEIPSLPITKGGNKDLQSIYAMVRDHIPKDIKAINAPQIELTAIFEFNKSNAKKFHRCDVDNLLKAVVDAIKGIAFIGDDRLITKMTAQKKISHRDMTTLHLTSEVIDEV
jgi:Holliday junction resolvase RusA-like endonuclease